MFYNHKKGIGSTTTEVWVTKEKGNDMVWIGSISFIVIHRCSAELYSLTAVIVYDFISY